MRDWRDGDKVCGGGCRDAVSEDGDCGAGLLECVGQARTMG